MWTAILEFLRTIFGWFKAKEDRAAAKEKILQEEPFKKAKEKQDAAKRADENEKLVGSVDGSGSKQDQDALAEIRKRVAK